MRPSLAPVDAGVGEAPAQGPGRPDVDTQGFELRRSIPGEVVRIARRRAGRQPSQPLQAVVQRDRDFACHVVVASACGSKTARSVGHEAFARPARENHQRFERFGDLGALQTVVAMFPLGERLDELLPFEPSQVHAGRRRAHIGHDSKLRARSRAAIQQAAEHAGPSRLGDGRGNSGQAGVGGFGIHTLMTGEAFRLTHEDTPNRDSTGP